MKITDVPAFLSLTKLSQEFALMTAKTKLVLAASGLIWVALLALRIDYLFSNA